MISLHKLADILEEKQAAVKEPDTGASAANAEAGLLVQEDSLPNQEENLLVQGDNLTVMRKLLAGGFAGKFQCLYMDPPFLSGADYRASVSIVSEKLGEKRIIKIPAYGDRQEEETYYEWLVETICLSKELLSETGLLWLHLDWHSVHYARVILDGVFGPENFLNEIIWQYKSGGSSPRHFGRKHDTILLYAKGPSYRLKVDKEKSYNRGGKPYRFQGVEEFKDKNGWYTMVNAKDVWAIDMVGRTSAERTGYATQKPLALMDRILKASTKKGDLVGDFCCGSGAFPVAAGRKGRRFVACDLGELALAHTEKRLKEEGVSYRRQKDDSLAEKNTPPQTPGDPLGKADRDFLEKVEKEDPEALVLFTEDLPGGERRVVDVFGRERIVPGK